MVPINFETFKDFATSHSLMFSLPELVAICFPSREKAIAATQPELLVSVNWSSPVFASHSLAVLSSEPDAICLPSGEKVISITVLKYEWPQSVFWQSPVLASHMIMFEL